MRIKCAAVRYSGKVYEGKDHDDITYQMVIESQGAVDLDDCDKGFVTDTGLFVSREAAYVIAGSAGQLGNNWKYGTKARLQSYDLI